MAAIDASTRAGVEFFTAQFARIAQATVPGVRFDAAFDTMHDAYRLRASARVPRGVGEKDEIFVVEQVVSRYQMESFANYADAATEVLKAMTGQLDNELVKHTQPPADVGALLAIAGMTARYVPPAEAFDLHWKEPQAANVPGPRMGAIARIDRGRPFEEWQLLCSKLVEVRELRETRAGLVVDVSPDLLRRFHDPRQDMKRVQFPELTDDNGMQELIKRKYAAYEDQRRHGASAQQIAAMQRQLEDLIRREQDRVMRTAHPPMIVKKGGPSFEPNDTNGGWL